MPANHDDIIQGLAERSSRACSSLLEYATGAEEPSRRRPGKKADQGYRSAVTGGAQMHGSSIFYGTYYRFRYPQ